MVALNIAARLDQPDLGTVYEEVSLEDLQVVQPARLGPGGAVSTSDDMIPRVIGLREVKAQWQGDYLDRLRNWSIVAVLGLAVASGAGGFVISGIMLQPVRDITDVASEISATNLSRRINYEGPDDEMKALADTFDSMIARLEAAFERQRQFAQDASHELRTPLTAIRTNIDVTEMDPDATVADLRETLDTVKAQTERLTRLTEDLLLLSRNEGESPETEGVPLAPMIAEVLRQMGPLATARGVELHAGPVAGLVAQASPDLLYRCLANLVDNAIKYGGAGSTVTITGSAPAAGAVEIAVSDSGPGIAPDELSHVFDRFYRVDRGRSRKEGGSGLGLAIVQELMRAQGGSVRVESAPGRGSTFTLSLPTTQPELAMGAARPATIA